MCKKRILMMVLVVILAVSLSITAYARWQYTASVDLILSSSRATVSIEGNDGVTLIKGTVTVSEEVSTGYWETRYSWPVSASSDYLYFSSAISTKSNTRYELCFAGTVHKGSASEPIVSVVYHKP